MDSFPIAFVNVTRQCNVSCKRCFLTEGHRKDRAMLSMELLEKLLSHELFASNPNTVVIWEGGEPTIVGEKRMYEYVNLARKILPNAKQTMVTNLFNAPDWLIKMAHEEFDSQFETTFALGGKSTLGGSESDYLKKFQRSLKKVTDAGILCPVNIELNRETYDMGVDYLAKIIKESNAKIWEFDISVDFHAFPRVPLYNRYGYPVLEGTITYDEMSSYMIDFYERHYEYFHENGFSFGILDQIKNNQSLESFNIRRGSDFITINPDGTLATNPLYSDLTAIHIGNLNTQSVDEALSSPIRSKQSTYEVKRTLPCVSCEFYSLCYGGSSHAALFDKTGECAGNKRLREYFKEKRIRENNE